jgi:phosphoenolpyruvate carboxykinase (GTP)
MDVDLAEWEVELESQQEWFDKLGKTLPRPISLQRDILLERVRAARKQA